MSASYIPKDVYTICTFQTDAEPRQLIPTRGTITVFYGTDKERPLLTVEDKNIRDTEFPCKNPKNAAGSFLSFGLGLIVGAALVLSGPVGWAVMAVGVGMIAVGVYKATKISHLCTESLNLGKWKIEVETVTFDGEKAITQNSMLLCDSGGILSPIFSYTVAKKYAGQISSNNNIEVGINAFASFFGGAGLVISAAEIGIAKTVLWMAGAMGFMQGGTYLQKDWTRSGSLDGNEHYDRMNTEVDPNSIIPGYISNPEDMTPGDLASPDILNVTKDGIESPFFVNPYWYIRDINGNLQQIRQGTQLARDLEALRGVENRQIHNTPEGKKIVQNIRAGRYPESMIRVSRDGNGVIRPVRLNNLAKSLPDVRMQNIKNIGTAGMKGGGFIAFVFPFIATVFSESSRKALAEAMAEDAGNGINVINSKA